MSTAIGFIGAGNIVSAILSGVAKCPNFNSDTIAIYDIDETVRTRYLSEGYKVYSSITELVEASPVVVIAVKPQIIESIIPELRKALTPAKVMVSIVAGMNIGWLTAQLGTSKVVCCMPNTPAQMGMGAFALSRGEGVDDRDFLAVRRFFERCGLVEEIPDALMCEVTAVNGSTPAFFYHIARIIAEEAVAMGFEEKTALRLLSQTMKGSAQMLIESGMSATTLEEKVCSPGGTTLAALARMDDLGLGDTIKEGMRACVKRCRELSK